jgi:hypothetical protein
MYGLMSIMREEQRIDIKYDASAQDVFYPAITKALEVEPACACYILVTLIMLRGRMGVDQGDGGVVKFIEYVVNACEKRWLQVRVTRNDLELRERYVQAYR